MLPYFHRRVSRAALRAHGVSEAVAAVVAETSRWTDWYRWNDPAANASTPTDRDGRPLDPGAAARASSARLREYLARTVSAVRDETPAGLRAGAVWLGFALHLVEDLASHEGRTVPEHAFQLLLLFPNPDWSRDGRRRGRAYCRRVLAEVERRLGSRFSAFARRRDARLPDEAEARRLLGAETFSLPALWETVREARHYLRLPAGTRRVRWDTERVLRDGLEER